MKVNADFFRPSGEWYMTESFNVPEDLSSYDIREWIEENRPYKNQFIMIINDEESMDAIDFPMLLK